MLGGGEQVQVHFLPSTKVGESCRRANCPLTFRSCSLTCFKTHAAQCTADPPDRKPESAGSTAETADATRRGPQKMQPQQPSLAELAELFKKYPTLREKLQDIYKATQRPEERPETNDSFRGRFNGRGRGRSSFPRNSTGDVPHWNPDKGLDRGLKQLQIAMEQETIQAEALRVFTEMILRKTMNSQSGRTEGTS
jgi:hypothetical protein